MEFYPIKNEVVYNFEVADRHSYVAGGITVHNCDDAADMGVVDLDSDFGGVGDPPAHVNCACDVSPVLADEADDTDE